MDDLTQNNFFVSSVSSGLIVTVLQSS